MKIYSYDLNGIINRIENSIDNNESMITCELKEDTLNQLKFLQNHLKTWEKAKEENE